jgi:hypothetical protein
MKEATILRIDQSRRVIRMLALVACVPVIVAQPQVILDDLESRAIAAVNQVIHPQTPTEAIARRGTVRRRLESSLGLHRSAPESTAATPAFLYLPKALNAPAPAVIVAFTHEGQDHLFSKQLLASMVEMGVAVFIIDLRVLHDRTDLLNRSILPQSLFQLAVREALEYLTARADIDSNHIAIMATGLVGPLAVALNPQLAAIAQLDGFSDIAEEIRRTRAAAPIESPDLCDIVPGLLQFATTEDLIAVVAPRPILTQNGARRILVYAKDLYRAFGVGGNIRDIGSMTGDGVSIAAIRDWMSSWLKLPVDIEQRPREESSLPEPISIQLLQRIPVATPLAEVPLRTALQPLLGTPLSRGRMTIGINPAQRQIVTLETQPGVEIAVTVFRPGPYGSDPHRGTLIALADEGRGTLESDPVVREAVRRGWMVWTVDPRGIGEAKTDREAFVLLTSLLLGENFAWRQASDVTRILDFSTHLCTQCPTALYARGKHATLVAAYIAAIGTESRPDWVALFDVMSSFEADFHKVPLYCMLLTAYANLRLVRY